MMSHNHSSPIPTTSYLLSHRQPMSAFDYTGLMLPDIKHVLVSILYLKPCFPGQSQSGDSRREHARAARRFSSIQPNDGPDILILSHFCDRRNAP